MQGRQPNNGRYVGLGLRCSVYLLATAPDPLVCLRQCWVWRWLTDLWAPAAHPGTASCEGGIESEPAGSASHGKPPSDLLYLNLWLTTWRRKERDQPTQTSVSFLYHLVRSYVRAEKSCFMPCLAAPHPAEMRRLRCCQTGSQSASNQRITFSYFPG